MNGVLVIDKPPGLTSHDVVAVARRALRERRIGHTGTLDPLATGVLPLACGMATRLVRFLTASDKDYDATIRFGVTTDTYDTAGTELTRSDARPTLDTVEGALASLRGAYEQMPPAYSAKKVGGQRAYDLARRNEPVDLKSVPVRVDRAELLAFTGDTATVALTCSAGFYVRSFAHTLGEKTGAGACLEALRRTRSGQFGLAEAVTLEELMAFRLKPEATTADVPTASDVPASDVPASDVASGFSRKTVAACLIPLERLMLDYPWARVSDEGRRRVSHGQLVRPEDLPEREPERSERPAGGLADWTRLLDAGGHLIAVAQTGPSSGSLHPSVVLI